MKRPLSYSAAALYGLELEREVEAYEQLVDSQLAEEALGWDEAGMYHAEEYDEGEQ